MSKKPLKHKGKVYFIASLGAMGIALQNYMAFISMLNSINRFSNLVKILASGLFSACSGLVNLCINIGLLEDFLKRFTGEKPFPKLQGWKKFRYYFGSTIFIITGLLFALTALAFGPVGPMAMLGLASGIFVGLIMTIQELETWLASFDNEEENKLSLWGKWLEWCKKLSLARAVGFIISLGNVLALSLLFTMGLYSFLLGFSIAAPTAALCSFVLAFSIGAFTEFYFYNSFITEFCEKYQEKWQQLMQSQGLSLGILSLTVNAAVNAAFCYSGVFLLAELMLGAGIVFNPLLFALPSAVFGGLASLLLGAEFWISNNKEIVAAFEPADTKPLLQPRANSQPLAKLGKTHQKTEDCWTEHYDTLWKTGPDSTQQLVASPEHILSI